MGTLYGVLLSLGILITHHFLAQRNNPVWGAIVPVLYLASILCLLIIKKVEFDMIFILGFLFLVVLWGDGRMRIKSKRKKELEKIAIKDL